VFVVAALWDAIFNSGVGGYGYGYGTVRVRWDRLGRQRGLQAATAVMAAVVWGGIARRCLF
jgi:hypothetical protein